MSMTDTGRFWSLRVAFMGMLALTSCAIPVEKHIFIADGEDPKARRRTLPRDERIDVTLHLTPEQRAFVWKGPYRVFVYLFEGTQWSGAVDSIEVAAAFLTVRYPDGDDQRLVLTDWRRVADPAAPGIYYIGRLPQKTLDVEHARVREIELHLELTAILKDGTRHRHVTVKHYRPVVLRDMESLLPAA